MQVEIKDCSGRIVETKVEERNGVSVGIVAGYVATWDVDSGGVFGIPDRFIRGAFLDSIQDHKDRGDRQVRLKDHHGRVIGGFPIDTVREDEKGLFGRGEINLVSQRGREIHALAVQRVLTDFSVGFTSQQDRVVDGIREISKAILWEGSVVDEPANPEAQIVEAKAVVPFQDLPLTDSDRPWNADAAKRRVRVFTNSEESPSPAYKRCFVWYDKENGDSFSAYKLPIADVVDDQLKAVPRGIFAAAAAVRGARGGVDIPEEDRPGVIRHLERYFAKMDRPSPFDRDERQFWGVQEIKDLTPAVVERVLRGSGRFSRGAAKALSDRLVSPARDSRYDMRKILRELKAARRLL